MTELLAPKSSGNEVFNVLSYGAKGDGTTDDTAAFNACITAASTYAASNGGAKVLIPPDSYIINGPVTLKSNITYDFRGAYIANGNTFDISHWHMFNYTAGASYSGASNVTVLGGVFDAKGQNAATWTTGNDIAKNLFLLGDGRNYRFDGCTFRNVPSYHAMDVNGIDGLVVNNCRFEGFVDNNSPARRNISESIQLQTSPTGNLTKNVRITNCYMGPAVDGSGLGSFGKLAGSHTDSNGNYYKNIIVTGNTVESPLQNGFGFYSLQDSVISNNVITGAGRDGIRLTAGNSSTTNVNANNVISGNTIRASTLNGICLEATTRTAVTGNYIYDCGAAGIHLGNPYSSDPTLTWPSTSGMVNSQPSPDNTLSNNVIVGASRTTNAARGSIDISGANNTKNFVISNSFRKYGSGNESNAPIYIRGTGAGNNYIIGNAFGSDWSTNYLTNINTSNAVFWDNSQVRVLSLTTPYDHPLSNITPATVPGMSFQADSNSFYEIEACIAVKVDNTTGTEADVRTAWSAPSGFDGRRLCTGPTLPGGTYTSRQNTAATFTTVNWNTNIGYRIDSVNQTHYIFERGIISLAGTGGTVAFQIAQNASSGTETTTIDIGTYIKYRKLDI